MHDPSDLGSRSKSGFTNRQTTDTRCDAASVARCSVFVALLGVGTLPVSLFVTTNFTPVIVYALFYVVLGFVALALRTPNLRSKRENETESGDSRETAERFGAVSSDD